VRGAKNSGNTYKTQGEARAAAQRYANKHPAKCEFRKPCTAGNHYHVDTYATGKGGVRKKIHTRHYYWEE
jgi:hypothetical protein